MTEPLEVLILGGNGQLGRHLVQAFGRAGHNISCLARGTRPVPAGVRFLRADRDRADALGEAARHRWDAVVELATAPGRVRRAVTELEADHWLYVSSSSVYRRGDVLEQDEASPVHAPLDAAAPSGAEDYGPAKVACEEAVRSGTPSATVVRPGLIAGAGDDTGRSGYYPWRFAHPSGEDVLVPDDPDLPVAMIDVKDLAAWMVRCAERRLTGTFNATGPTVTLRDALAASRSVAARTAAAVPGVPAVPARAVPPRRLLDEGIRPWMGPDSLPWWIPDPRMRYAATADSRRARENGLVCRPLEATLADALASEESRGGPVGAGLRDATERRLRAALDG